MDSPSRPTRLGFDHRNSYLGGSSGSPDGVSMTQEEIISMAREAGASQVTTPMNADRPAHSFSMTHLERFAKLVAEKEREACAEICKKHADVYALFEQNPLHQAAWAACIDDRDAIRARGEQ